VQLFSREQYDEAINVFLELDTNPAKVVALYPESVSGRLAKPRKEWVGLFGGTPNKGISGLENVAKSGDGRNTSGQKISGDEAVHGDERAAVSTIATSARAQEDGEAQPGDIVVQADSMGNGDLLLSQCKCIPSLSET
jgi:hypothetical protein